jgi:hypothetical protein
MRTGDIEQFIAAADAVDAANLVRVCGATGEDRSPRMSVFVAFPIESTPATFFIAKRMS